MNRTKQVELLQEWSDKIINIYQELDKGIIDNDGILVTNLEFMIDSYTDLLCIAIGDTDNKWLDWYRFENDMGKGGIEVILSNGDSIEISDVNRLLIAISDDYE